MVFEFKFPDVGEGIHEGKLVKWLVKEGDKVKADQPVAEVETDKAVIEIPCPQDGYMLKWYFKEGDVVKVGKILFAVGEQEEKAREIDQSEPAVKKLIAPTPIKKAESAQAPATISSVPAPSGRVLATPATRKFAKDMGVGIESVKGTGPGGRITIVDVKNYKEAGAAEEVHPAAALPAGVPARPAHPPIKDDGPVERVKVSGLQKAVADKMVLSVYTAPHVAHMEEVDVTRLIEIRAKAKEEAKAQGVKLTYLPFIIKALVGALKEFPKFNARYDASEKEVVVRKYYNVGVAVDTEEGLLVPVIHDADKKDLMGLAEEITRLSEEARVRKLKLEDIRGGTFT
ncbi:MAG: 2-oxo acid dehydrogenase subunit E2, partial [Candidatus Aenigmarchaeota archaeon]|nr:2-oxo acid dehydrogenase subunit E2 [Candidatus Aenigmarchaeota archaeon]